ncbi:MAG: flagellar hook-associated protein FlgK [Desulfobacterales bacterium]|nr:flagellar hook-associated protein FlgK [Desulfobacterales bacterium]
MSGLGLVLDIAKDALAAQRYGMDVTSHNIANVNTEGYSRQRTVSGAKQPALYGGLLLGRGVETTQVLRISDRFIENRLMDQKSAMLFSKEMEHYMQVLEAVLNENSEASISTMIANFWNMWHDVANNPSGTSERMTLYEHSILLLEQFNTLDDDLTQLEAVLTNAVSTGTNKVNQITKEIAQINQEIIGMEASGVVNNDVRDSRNALVSELNGYIDVNTFEQSNGSLTIITSSGHILVHEHLYHDLTLGGDDGKRILWHGSGGSKVDITDYITKGKLGGWIDMRDEVVAKYKLDLDALVKEFTWTVNRQHSRGVGLHLFSGDVTGTYKTDSSGLLSTLTYGQEIDYTKDFRMWIDDGSSPKAVTVDMGISGATLSNWAGPVAGAARYKYVFTVTTPGTVGPGADDPVISWEKFNPDGSATGSSGSVTIVNAGNFGVDGGTLSFDIGAGTLVAGNTFTINTDSVGNPDLLDIAPSGKANSISDTYKFAVTSSTGNGKIGTDTLEIKWSNSITLGVFTLDASTTTVDVDGMTIDFIDGTLFNGDVFTISTDENGNPSPNLPSDWHWTLDSFKDRLNGNVQAIFGSAVVDASVTGNALKLSPAGGCSFGFCDHNFDGCGLLAALGINTFFEGSSAGFVGMNAQVANKDHIAAGRINNNVGPAIPADTNSSTGSITTAGPYTGADDATYTIRIEAGGAFRWQKNDGGWSAPVNITIGSVITIDKGITLTFDPGTYAVGDTFTIDVIASTDPSQIHTTGDNSNALAICDLQYASVDIAQWTCDRRNENTKDIVSATIEQYYHCLVSSIGIESASAARSRAFIETTVGKLGEIRDSISAVSLDEEMTNLIKFQHAYAAAAKLISVSDEMMKTLLSVK